MSSSPFSLDKRIALITGAGGHLGTAMARGLAEAGAHVVLTGRRLAKLQALETTLCKQGLFASAFAADLTQEPERTALVAYLRDTHGRLDILVNNAHSGRTATVETATAEDFTGATAMGMTIPFLLVQAALPLLEKSEAEGGASVINIASMYGTVSPDGRVYGDSGQNSPPFYGAAKAGLIQLTRYLACHLAERGIRVNAISPGPFPRPKTDAAFQSFEKQLREKTPLGRMGQPDELIGPLVFLASPGASYVTGANLPVDGGWTAW